MRIIRPAFLALLPFHLALTAPLSAQTVMIGIVRDDSTARPLAGVEVLLTGTSHRITTGEDGRYRLAGLPDGRFQVIFRAVGYLPSRVEVLLVNGESTRVNQSLVPSTVVLDPIEVTGEPDVGLAGRGFHERMKMGFGRFYTPEELREMEHLKVTDVLRRKGGVTISQFGFNGPMWAMNSNSRNSHGFLNCIMSIYLDGTRIFAGGKTDQLDSLQVELIPDLRRLMSVNHLAAIEVYRSAAGIPVEFGGSTGQCGAVVLWTRRAP
ncbi:MAG: carboxypeptidase-like regulatory domain-containing protein [Gemmatimonadales bacterium]